ncbi:hypothetical protein, partial [Actinoplanes couchii]|uniref:hypothetical protein n=1 Tax=Actinoplanes couchii TaxID=403638 RepID=UPI0031E32656
NARLTDEEISEAAAGTAWDLQRTDPVWVLRTDFGSSGPNCFSFDITTPLGPATRVTTTEFSTCPLVKPRTS